MPNYDAVSKQVLKKLKPSEAERKSVSDFVATLLATAKLMGHECEVCGSIGKFTWLAGDHDIDLFVFFPEGTSREQLENDGIGIGENIAKKLGGKTQIKYAEHPYVHAIIKGFDVDIVPCYKIRKGEHIRSAVDRSPLHLEYVLANIKTDQFDEVRLLKQFCKGIGVYGADAKTQGISGYICELLVIQYGSFVRVLEQATNWRAPHAIGESTQHFDTPFIVIDPTDAARNAAAAVSAENFARFIFAAQQFLKKPSAEFFFPKTKCLSSTDITKLKKRGTRWIAIAAPRPDVIDDVLWPQLRRARHRLVKELEQNEFKVIRSFDWADESDHDVKKPKSQIALVFELEVWALPTIQRMHGPPITSHEHSKHFLEKYGKPMFGPFVDGQGSWFIEKNRSFETVDKLIQTFLRRPTKKLEEAGIPDSVAATMKRHKFFADAAFWKFAKSPAISAAIWKKYMKKLQ